MDNVEGLFKQAVDEIERMLNTNTVVGEPLTIGDNTIIPLVSVGFGFAAGGGSGKEPSKGEGTGGGTGRNLAGAIGDAQCALLGARGDIPGATLSQRVSGGAHAVCAEPPCQTYKPSEALRLSGGWAACGFDEYPCRP